MCNGKLCKCKPQSYVRGGLVKTKRAKRMEDGGVVKAKGAIPKKIRVEMQLDQVKGSDRVPAILAAGELVIPKRLASKVTRFLKKEGDHIPGL
jgi:hypothetical protein